MANLFILCFQAKILVHCAETYAVEVLRATLNSVINTDFQEVVIFSFCSNQKTFAVVVLLFYVHGEHLRSCRDG